jgi:hypothetical protein
MDSGQEVLQVERLSAGAFVDPEVSGVAPDPAPTSEVIYAKTKNARR